MSTVFDGLLVEGDGSEPAHLQDGLFFHLEYSPTRVDIVLTLAAAGDANGDAVFDSSDLVQVFQAGEYEDGVAGNSTWVTELEPVLREAFEQAPEGATYCIERYRSPDVNLRTHLVRIIRKAGVEPWTKPLQNLRASRETELVDVHPLHVVTAWLGNTPRVAEKHYL